MYAHRTRAGGSICSRVACASKRWTVRTIDYTVLQYSIHDTTQHDTSTRHEHTTRYSVDPPLRSQTMRRGSVFLHEPGTSPSFLNPHMCHIVDSLDRVSSSRQPPDSHVDRVYCTHGRPWTDRRGRDAQMVYCMWQAWLRSECEVRVNYSTCTVQHIHVRSSTVWGGFLRPGGFLQTARADRLPETHVRRAVAQRLGRLPAAPE